MSAWQSLRFVGVDAVLVGFLASLPLYDQFAAVQETSYIAHDTTPVSRILS